MRRVILESPWAGNIRKHRNYARKAIRDCLKRGEAPIASHLLYTQPGILKDAIDAERAKGIQAGWAWMGVADAVVIYADYGFSRGMFAGMEAAAAAGTPIEIRYIFKRVGAPGGRSKAKRDSGKVRKGGGSRNAMAVPKPLSTVQENRQADENSS